MFGLDLALCLVAVVVIGIEPAASKKCSMADKCGNGEGDCDYKLQDRDCAGNLVCGKNNCWGQFGTAPGGDKGKDDCCTTHRNFCSLHDVIPPSRKKCCSKENPCREGEGDCDGNVDCMDGLICGQSNCKDYGHKDARPTDDCCARHPASSSSIPGCRCNNHINSYGYGQCQKSYKNWFGGAKFCYVDNPGACSDARQSVKESWRYISAQPCRSNPQVTPNCSYACTSSGGCTVSYVGHSRSGKTKGSCFPNSFGGSCSGTPPECYDCNRVVQCSEADYYYYDYQDQVWP